MYNIIILCIYNHNINLINNREEYIIYWCYGHFVAESNLFMSSIYCTLQKYSLKYILNFFLL